MGLGCIFGMVVFPGQNSYCGGLFQVSRNKKSDTKDVEIIDRIDMVNKNMANIRSDIAAIVRDTVLQILKENNRPRPHIEVGYR